MGILYIALTVGTIGKVVLGVAVWRVHAHILEEHKIDKVVLTSIKRERYVTLLGVLLIIIGYLMEVWFYGTAPLLGGL
jgi:hypothetical protein